MFLSLPHYNKVRVRCERDKAQWHFPCGRWFDALGHDGATSRELTASAVGDDKRGSNVYMVGAVQAVTLWIESTTTRLPNFDGENDNSAFNVKTWFV